MYYELRQTPVMSGLYMTFPPDLSRRVRWRSGRKHTESISEPIQVELRDDYGTQLPDIFTDNIPLVSERLLECLKNAGVSNFDVYDVVLVDKQRNLTLNNYKAIQIIGRVAAADLNASKTVDHLGTGDLVEFEELKLDESAAKGIPLFRLHEDTTRIIVLERVKNEIEKLDLGYVTVAPIGEKVVPELDEDEDEDEDDDE